MAKIRKLLKTRPTLIWLAFFILGLVFLYIPKGVAFFISGFIVNNLYFPFYRIGLSLESYKNRYEENLSLKRDVVELSLALDNLREAKYENERLRDLLEFKANTTYELRLARIIERLNGGTVIVDKGEKEGIKKNMPALHLKGVVGKVIDASDRTSTIELYTNPNFMISAVDSRSRVLGIVQPDLKGGLKMENVPIGSDVNYGDEIVSSGLGGIFPKGLLIGTVKRVFEPKDKMFMEILIEPASPISKLEELFILIRSDK